MLFAIISMLAFGTNGGVVKKLVKDLGPLKYGFYRNLGLTVVLLIILVLNLNTINLNWLYILLAVLLSVVIYIGFYITNIAIKKGRLGIVLPITSSRIIITTLLAGIVLKENLDISQYLLIFVIIVGIITLSVNFKELKSFSLNGKGIKEAGMSAIIFGVVMTFYGLIGKEIGANLLGFIVEVVILIGSAIHLVATKESILLTEAERKTYGKTIILMTLLAVVGVYFSNIAYVIGSVSIVTAISAASPIVTTLYDRFVHKEIMNIQENLGMMVVIGGIIVLSII